MLSRFRHVAAVLFFLLIASCSGGGCSGCSGCAGTTPLPGGFPAEKAIANAASVRVSRPGIDFIETNMPAVAGKLIGATGGIFGIDIPNIDPGKTKIADLSVFGEILIDPNVCVGGPDPTAVPPKCRAEVNLGASQFQIDSVKPNAIQLRATIPLKLEDTAISASASYDPPVVGEVGLGGITIHVGYGDGGCSNGRPQVTPYPLPIGVTIPLVAETLPPRIGYTKIDVANATIDLSGLNENQVRVCANCGFAAAICSAITDSSFIKGLALGPLKSGLQGQVRNLLEDQLCMKPDATLNPPCPTDTVPDGSNKKCVYEADKNKCVPILLGLGAHMDLSSALRSISPGTVGALDFGLAAYGDMQPAPNADAANGRTPNGITLGMIGGVLPQPESKCVPAGGMPTVPTGIPIPDELAPTVVDPAGTPHVGIAVAGRFLDFSLASVYKSGLLCLGVSTEQIDLLKTGLISIIAPSMANLTFNRDDAAAAIATRPQAPPTIKVGGGTDINKDPLLLLTLPKFAIDFYVWSYDRYVRAMTFQADLSVPVNLQTAKDPVKNPNGGLVPILGDVKVANGSITNSDLLFEDPAVIANALNALIGGIAKQAVGSGINPIDLSGALSSLGLGMEINKITKLTKGTDDFLGVFATMTPPAAAATPEADTLARFVSKTVHADKMQLGTISRDALPELVVDVSSPLDDGKRAIEYAWWIDNGTRAAWAREKHIVIRDEQLLIQGRHVLRVAARVVGQSASEDTTPAEIPFVIDALAPFVKVERSGSRVSVDAWDLVSPSEALVGRYRVDTAPFGDFKPLAEIAKVEADEGASLEIEVKDEEGNVRTIQQGLIRGRTDSSLTANNGCGCQTPGTRDVGGSVALIAVAAGIALIALRRRTSTVRTALALGSMCVVTATTQGCGCGSEAETGTLCGPGCDEECRAGLSQGLPGSYTSVAKAPDGALWVAGYNDALLQEGEALLFGDLVVGKYDAEKQSVDWKTVDGIPARPEGCAERSKDSWRSGESDAGDNVGLWTSLQVSTENHPMVSYYDATNRQLKFAVEDGGWSTFVLKAGGEGSDIGRYSKMILDGDKPAVAFLLIEPGNQGRTRSKLVIARSNVPTPRGADAFSFEDVAVEESNPCRVTSCGPSLACVKATGLCVPKVTGCPEACGNTEECITVDNKADCATVKTTLETYPDVFGDYISFAKGPNGFGMVVYDRPHGNLVAVAQEGGAWKRIVLDGEIGSRPDKTAIDTGDVGVAASLFIDTSNTWHVSYVNGVDESVRYISYAGGKVAKSEIVDDGTGVDGKLHTDGKHVVGDDSAIRVEGETVTIYYQDASSGTLRRAVGTKNGAAHKWELRAIPQPNRFAGFFPQFVPGESKVTNFWRETDKGAKSVTGNVSIVSP